MTTTIQNKILSIDSLAQKAEELSQRKIDVIDILMVLDISSSMLADDFPPNRLEAVKKTAKEFNKNFLGKIPLNQDLRNSADQGEPLTHSDPDHEVSKIFKDIAEKVKQSFR